MFTRYLYCCCQFAICSVAECVILLTLPLSNTINEIQVTQKYRSVLQLMHLFYASMRRSELVSHYRRGKKSRFILKSNPVPDRSGKVTSHNRSPNNTKNYLKENNPQHKLVQHNHLPSESSV